METYEEIEKKLKEEFPFRGHIVDFEPIREALTLVKRCELSIEVESFIEKQLLIDIGDIKNCQARSWRMYNYCEILNRTLSSCFITFGSEPQSQTEVVKMKKLLEECFDETQISSCVSESVMTLI